MCHIKTLERALKNMNTGIEYQLNLVFEYYKRKADHVLNNPDFHKDPKYNQYRTWYDTLVKQAKSTGLI